MNKNLALYTFGAFAKSANDPANDGFHFLNDKILPQVDRAIGLIERSGYDGEPGPATWEKQIFPTFFIDTGDGWSPSTLSL